MSNTPKFDELVKTYGHPEFDAKKVFTTLWSVESELTMAKKRIADLEGDAARKEGDWK